MERLASLLSAVLSRAALDDEVALIFLRELWTEMVGEELGARTRPHWLRDKRLTLSVPNEIWKNELASLTQKLLQTVNGYWGMTLVKKIELRVEAGLDGHHPQHDP